MHPHLADAKKLHCGDLIKALEDCHAQGYFSRLTGSCNGIKRELNMCLREERLIRTAKNREGAKERRAKEKDAWSAIDEES